jgi:hypothetical protein
MGNFKIGDIVKRENGKNIFEIINIRGEHHRFGDIRIKNLDTGKIYWDYSEGGRAGRKPFIIHFKDFEPKKIKYLKFDFKNGI